MTLYCPISLLLCLHYIFSLEYLYTLIVGLLAFKPHLKYTTWKSSLMTSTGQLRNDAYVSFAPNCGHYPFNC